MLYHLLQVRQPSFQVLVQQVLVEQVRDDRYYQV
jgi:hypothetical protein